MATSPVDIFGPLGAPDPMAGLTTPGDQSAIAPATLPSGSSPADQSPAQTIRLANPDEPPPSAIDKLRPGSDLHQRTLDKLVAMEKFSHTQMKHHYSRWNFAEQKIQAYTTVNDYERLVNELNSKDATIPEPVSVVVPYSYATIHAGATFVANVLLGRKPVFPLLGVRGTAADNARHMEQALQSNLDSSRGYEQLWQHIWDSFVYAFGVNQCGWEERTGNAIRWVQGVRQNVVETTFAGNVIASVDPYALRPDPRVPIHECNIRGDFMFAVKQQSETVLRDAEKDGLLKWVNEAIAKSKTQRRQEVVTDNRRRVKIGIRGEDLITPTNVVSFHTVYEGTVRLTPKEWGIGDSDRSELWKFTWMAGQILQAEPLGMMHSMHPFVASEPTSFGHDFMSLSMHDMIGPFQDILSWLVSSRMENVRTAINNQFVADPARVEINDIRTSTIGRIIRLKQAAMGLPVKEAIMQLLVQDVTGGHIADIQTMRILADTITGVNDNLRGIQTAGGRRSATEARMSMQAGASRLSQLAIRISSQGWLPLANQMIMNIQQFMPDKMWVEVTGDDGTPNSKQMTPDMLMGSFNFQISDGSLPFDKTALIEVWKEILFGVAQDPELRQTWSLPQLFRYVAELGGAKNIDSFKQQALPAPPVVASAQADPAANPNLVPIGAGQPQGPIRF